MIEKPVLLKEILTHLNEVEEIIIYRFSNDLHSYIVVYTGYIYNIPNYLLECKVDPITNYKVSIDIDDFPRFSVSIM